MEPKILGVGPRTAAFLRATYPKSRAKLIARDFRVSKATAERWLAGEAPTVAHIEQMTAFFGEPYIRTVFAEAFERQDERIKTLEISLFRSLIAGGISGVVAGFSYARGLADQGANFLEGLTSWASRLLGLQTGPPMIEMDTDPDRLLLLEDLIRTVPALNSPKSSNGVGGKAS